MSGGDNGGIHQQVVKLFRPHGEQTQTQNSPALQRYVTIPAASRFGLQKGTDSSVQYHRFIVCLAGRKKGKKLFAILVLDCWCRPNTQRVLVSAPPPPPLPFTFAPLALHNSNHLIWLISGRARDLTSEPQQGRWAHTGFHMFTNGVREIFWVHVKIHPCEADGSPRVCVCVCVAAPCVQGGQCLR